MLELVQEWIAVIREVMGFVGAEVALFKGLAVALVTTEGVKQILLPRILSHQSSADTVRATLRAVAFIVGFGFTFLLWVGDWKEGVFWAFLNGAGAPVAYQVGLSLAVARGWDWAKRMQAADAILRRHKPTPEEVEAAPEHTVMGAARGRRAK